MTDKPVPAAKPRRTVRKGAPPTPAETLGTLTSAAEAAVPSLPPAEVVLARAEKPKAAKQTAVKSEPAAKPKKPVSERTKPLNFRVTNEFRKAFKQAAANEDCKKVELLERMFEAWRAAKSGKAN